MQGPQVREKVMMMRCYTEPDWAALKKEMLVVFRHADSRPDSLVYTHHYLQNLCADVAGRKDTEALEAFLRSYNHISGVVTERGIMCEYERMEMLLRALPKRLWRKAVTKLGMHPLEPSTFGYGKLHSWITAKITAAEALVMFEFMAPKSPAATEMTPSTSLASTTPSASLTSASMTAPTTPTFTGIASPTNLTVPTAPTVQPTAPMTSENLTIPTAFTPSTPTTTLALSISTAQTAPILTMAAETLITPPAPSPPAPSPPTPSPAKQGRKTADAVSSIHTVINNRDRLVLGTAGGEIPLEPAYRDCRTIKDYARAGAPILSAPSPAPAPSPPSQPAPLQTPPPARLSPLPAPLLSPEQLSQLMREVSEHFARSRQYGVDVSPPAAPSPQKPRPRQTAHWHPSPAARKARKLEQQRSICV
ncbi:hypothetical protein K440DRAFT_683589 [Wilcoxina mikolae CBS 423.85]|nr:hypothetical protein K440DRAFT_683589 [Wilcoxina mikolae CBS 423.85]